MEDEQEEEEDIVTIGTIDNQQEMAIVKSVFEDRNIWYFIADELTNTIIPIYGAAMGHARLQVRKSDTEVALKVLEEIRRNSDIDVEEVWKEAPEELQYFKKDEQEAKTSSNITRIIFWIVAILLAIGIYLGAN